MLNRSPYLDKIAMRFDINPICAILGPRQCGKTTLALEYAKKYCGNLSTGAKSNASVVTSDYVDTAMQTRHGFQEFHHFDLENPRHQQALENPMLALENLDGLIILDEIQRAPDLFPVIRYLVDHLKKKFLILGSASRDLIQQSSESLAGRISFMELTPFCLDDVHDLQKHMFRGGFPKAYLATTDDHARLWQEDYITTFMERDLALLGIKLNPFHLRKLWVLLAHYHGQLMNYSAMGNSLGLTHTTVIRYVEILNGTFMIRVLKPWYENIGKRQIKAPKVYIRDSGLCHALLSVEKNNLLGHPKTGALWEGYALEEVCRHLDMRADDCYFWRTENGTELDLFIQWKGRRIGFEFKYADAPTLTKSMHIAKADLMLDDLYVVVPKTNTYAMDQGITATDLMGLWELLRK
jgi:predicted AAA+ superfamily ATPase